jgi:hypothetical protein
MRISFTALFALLLASAFPQARVYAQALPPGPPYIQVPIPGIPGELVRSAGTTGATIGSTASALGTENMTFATAWLTRALATSEEGWSIDFARCVTSVSGVEIGEDHVESPGHPGRQVGARRPG